MTAASESGVTAAVEQAGGKLLAIHADESCPGIESKFYVGTKK
jgi:hypothetical protein